jgi:chromosome segregation ATPase
MTWWSWVLVAACAGQGGVRQQVGRADASQVATDPRVREAQQAVTGVRVRRERAEAELARVRLELAAAERRLEIAEADEDATDAELRAARLARDAERREAALARRELARTDGARARGERAWKRREVTARDAVLTAARAEEQLRASEVELARAESLAGSGEAGAYALSGFIAQRARLQAAWESAERRARSAVEDAAEAERQFRAGQPEEPA